MKINYTLSQYISSLQSRLFKKVKAGLELNDPYFRILGDEISSLTWSETTKEDFDNIRKLSKYQEIGNSLYTDNYVSYTTLINDVQTEYIHTPALLYKKYEKIHDFSDEIKQEIMAATTKARERLEAATTFSAYFLGIDLHKAIDENNSKLVLEIMNHKQFSEEVLFAMNRIAKSISDDERMEKTFDATEEIERLRNSFEEVQKNAERAIHEQKFIGVKAMADANRRFTDDEKIKIQIDAENKKASNKNLSSSAINQQLALKYKVSSSTIYRVLKDK
jgi:diadenosine tetraphosphate (Ap4A) HIT family hydrolase